jgi:hypothetical protein
VMKMVVGIVVLRVSWTGLRPSTWMVGGLTVEVWGLRVLMGV